MAQKPMMMLRVHDRVEDRSLELLPV